MSIASQIEWTEATWNPVTGCTKVSPGCDNCYAERITERFHGKGSFAVLRRDEGKLYLPLKWRKPRRIFVNSMSDLFHDDVPAPFIGRVFSVMAQTPQHTYQILTKRHGRMRAMLSTDGIRQVVAEVTDHMPEATFMSWDVQHGSGAYDRLQPWRVGKKRAGRELDGRTWDQYPAPAEVAA